LPKPWNRSAGRPGKARFWPRAALLSLSGLGRRPADSVGAAARAAAQRTPETLTVVRQRAQPTAVTIARLAGTAVFAYLLALQLPGSSRPVIAPLTVDTRAAATSRIIETLLGAGAGLLSSFILAAPRVQPAEEAVDDLCRQMADLLDQMAQGLVDGAPLDASGEWLARARALAGEIRRVDAISTASGMSCGPAAGSACRNDVGCAHGGVRRRPAGHSHDRRRATGSKPEWPAGQRSRSLELSYPPAIPARLAGRAERGPACRP
jgi:hypothetical protein